MKLLFKNMVFNKGVNVTCRRGVKWDLETEAFIDGYGNVPISTRVIPFYRITGDMLADEHDFTCRFYGGLYEVMEEIYPGFHEDEIVTLVTFEVK